jgi:hypothetical protein
MSHPFSPEGTGPTPQQLAAYVDGELGPADRAVVEAWLRDHPDGRADIEGQRELLRLWQGTAAPDPGEEAWATVLVGAEAGALAGAGPSGAGGGRLRLALRLATALTSAAAVLLLALGLMRLWTPHSHDRVAPLPVASTGDVEILSMEGGDVASLVVGEPPVRGPLNLASAEDVTVDNSGHDVQIVSQSPPRDHATGGHSHKQPVVNPMIIPADPSTDKTP